MTRLIEIPESERNATRDRAIMELLYSSALRLTELCKVDIRTARRWKSGKTRMPDAARMIVAGDLGCFDPAFRGWIIRDGKLISPEGWGGHRGRRPLHSSDASSDQRISGQGAGRADHGRAAPAR
jgi:hypothetical protein